MFGNILLVYHIAMTKFIIKSKSKTINIFLTMQFRIQLGYSDMGKQNQRTHEI